MFTKKNDISQTDHALNRLYDELTTLQPSTEEYTDILGKIEKFHNLKNESRSERVKPDTIALIAGNLAGIMLIVGHERAHVVTSKALSFVSKLK